ncbi:hypothetical protein cand_037960 [Cryptosporidium andersoni]|uniref:Uncharacterized protein n=1 Tax=Cryptosporidium andersoni TaxID=117008 RepID=A0A1J4MY41_9CRYT|nr:hypothetical protein cand_037960 [Cryptosporidium andersoni]
MYHPDEESSFNYLSIGPTSLDNIDNSLNEQIHSAYKQFNIWKYLFLVVCVFVILGCFVSPYKNQISMIDSTDYIVDFNYTDKTNKNIEEMNKIVPEFEIERFGISDMTEDVSLDNLTDKEFINDSSSELRLLDKLPLSRITTDLSGYYSGSHYNSQGLNKRALDNNICNDKNYTKEVLKMVYELTYFALPKDIKSETKFEASDLKIIGDDIWVVCDNSWHLGRFGLSLTPFSNKNKLVYMRTTTAGGRPMDVKNLLDGTDPTKEDSQWEAIIYDNVTRHLYVIRESIPHIIEKGLGNYNYGNEIDPKIEINRGKELKYIFDNIDEKSDNIKGEFEFASNREYLDDIQKGINDFEIQKKYWSFEKFCPYNTNLEGVKIIDQNYQNSLYTETKEVKENKEYRKTKKDQDDLKSKVVEPHYHSHIIELALVNVDGQDFYEVIENCASEYLFMFDNKGFEGAVGLRTRQGEFYILGLCEGNYCLGGVQGEQPGNGRLVLMKKVYISYQHNTPADIKIARNNQEVVQNIENKDFDKDTNKYKNGNYDLNENSDIGASNITKQLIRCIWKTVRMIEVPSEVKFQDYSSIDVKGSKVAITSQEDSAVWIGNINYGDGEFLDPQKLSLIAGGKTYYFPRDYDCDYKYCNIEGVSFISDNLIVTVSDKMKKNKRQSPKCLEKDQSVHVFSIPI